MSLPIVTFRAITVSLLPFLHGYVIGPKGFLGLPRDVLFAVLYVDGAALRIAYFTARQVVEFAGSFGISADAFYAAARLLHVRALINHIPFQIIEVVETDVITATIGRYHHPFCFGN